jgi:hypothetical protein
VLGVARSFVYAHAAELGGYRLGTGPRARLRFDLEDVRRRISCRGSRESGSADSAPEAASRPRRRLRTGTNVELLPIRGRSTVA